MGQIPSQATFSTPYIDDPGAKVNLMPDASVNLPLMNILQNCSIFDKCQNF